MYNHWGFKVVYGNFHKLNYTSGLYYYSWVECTLFKNTESFMLQNKKFLITNMAAQWKVLLVVLRLGFSKKYCLIKLSLGCLYKVFI